MVTEPQDEARYFRFPIAALYGDLPGVFERALRYAIVHCADFDVPEKFDSEIIETIGASEAGKYDYDKELTDSTLRLLVACKLLNVQLGELVFNTYKKFKDSHDDCVKSFGKCFVVFPRDKFWQYRDSPEQHRDFAILCGVFAGLGNDLFKKLQYERIGAMASGFSSVKELKASRAPLRYTRDQVRWTVDKLEQQGWFVRCPANRRHMYYSKKLSLSQLQQEIAKMVVAKQSQQPKMAKRKEELTKLIARLELQSQSPQRPH